MAAVWMAPALRAMAADEGGLGDVVDTFVKTNGFHGVIHLVRDGQVAFSQAFGMADVEAGRRASVDTLYPVASISKWLTSVTVLRLVDQGKLKLEGTIADYLPDYRPDTGGRVQLKHLLSNASGIPKGLDLKADPALWTKAFTTGEAIKAFCSGDLVFEPGSRFSYDFTNWIIVKGIVEKVTGKDFAEAVDALTLTPLGATGIVPGYAERARTHVAAGYATIEPPVRKMNPPLPYTLASGGYCGTAPDLVRAAHGVYGTDFLSAGCRQALATVLVPGESYALGGRVKSLTIAGKPQLFAWETGRLDGYRSLLAHRLDGKATLVVLNNTDLSQKAIDVFGEAMLSGA
jgi:CubicO group peptidase (beta-lactamase class C family)